MKMIMIMMITITTPIATIMVTNQIGKKLTFKKELAFFGIFQH